MNEMKTKEQISQKVILVMSIALISFGTINATNNAIAQPTEDISVKCFDSEGREIVCTKPWDLAIQNIFEQLLSTVGPIVAGAVAMGFSFARKKGLQISAEAEEYFINSARSFVENQSRYIFKQFMSNPEYREQLSRGEMPEKLGKEVFQNVKNQLEVELRSDELTRTARNMLEENLDALIERTLSESKDESAKKARKLLQEFAPLAVDSTLLYIKEKEISDEQKEEIVKKSIDIMARNFDNEYMVMSVESAKMYIEAELMRKIKQQV